MTFRIAPVGASVQNTAEMSDLRGLIARLVGRFGSQTALAHAIGLSPSRLSRVMTGESLDVITCLKLAEVTGESPSDILRAAGKAETAMLIEQMYGRPNPPQDLLAPRLVAALREPDIVSAVDALMTLSEETRGLWIAVLKERARDVYPQPNRESTPEGRRAAAGTASASRRHPKR